MSSQAASVNFPHAPMLPLWPANVRPLIQRWWCWGLALLIHVACLGINLSLRTAPPPPILQASLYIPATPVDPPRPTPAPIADTHPHAGPQLLPKRPAALPTAATIRSIDEAIHFVQTIHDQQRARSEPSFD
ncbi:MAG TPA: hypothetical protein PLW86_08075, partial [Rhodocyclaceae bacterium]|nr:hypothetical protein [Rhodocyclaceae bacterium]